MSRVHLALLGLATVGHISARLLTLPVLVGPTATLANPEPFPGVAVLPPLRRAP